MRARDCAVLVENSRSSLRGIDEVHHDSEDSSRSEKAVEMLKYRRLNSPYGTTLLTFKRIVMDGRQEYIVEFFMLVNECSTCTSLITLKRSTPG